MDERTRAGSRGRIEPRPVKTTLMELVRAVGEVARDDREVVATVHALLASGRIRLARAGGGERPLPH
jgi:hypothetical protein